MYKFLRKTETVVSVFYNENHIFFLETIKNNFSFNHFLYIDFC